MPFALYLKIISSILFSLFVFMHSANAELELKGQVLERGTKKPLANVNVFILPEGLKATSDKDGNFVFSNAPRGEREWILTVTGYKRVKEKFTYQGNTSNIRIFVEKNSYVDFETTVVGRREKKEAARTVLKQEEFITLPGSAGDPVRALENLPGVLQSFDANVAIQGSPPEDTKYLIEGHEIPFIFHFFGLNTVAVPETVESVEFLTAGYGPEYGRASSGIINLNLRQPRKDRSYGMAYIDFTASGGFLEGRITEDKKQSYFVGGRYSYVGEVIKFASEQIDDEEDSPPAFNTAPTYWDINLTYLNESWEKMKFRLITLASQDRVEAIVDGADNPTFSRRVFGTTRFYRVIPKLEFDFSSRSKFETSLGVGTDISEFKPGEQEFLIDNFRLSWRSNYSREVSDIYNFNIGTDFIFQDSTVETRIAQSFFSRSEINTPFEISDLIIGKQKSSELQQGYFLRNEFRLFSQSLKVQPNLRYDYFKLHNRGYLQPRLSVIYSLTEDSSLYFNSGIYVQPENSINLSEESGNPDLLPTQSNHYSIRYEHDFRQGKNDGLLLTSGVFYKNLKDLITDSSELVTRDGEQVPERFSNSGKGEVKGLETLLRYQKGKTKVNFGYTYTESTRIDPLTGQEFPSEQDQTHNLNLTVAYSWGNWNLSGRFRYVTGLPKTPIESGIYFENADIYLPVQGERFSERLGDFWQLDARLDRKWIYDTWILSFYLDIQNITNRENPTGIAYSFDYSERDTNMGLPILPSFGVKGEF